MLQPCNCDTPLFFFIHQRCCKRGMLRMPKDESAFAVTLAVIISPFCHIVHGKKEVIGITANRIGWLERGKHSLFTVRDASTCRCTCICT
mmetsp:Transcript_116198/g.333674  ORF Transcript_116198/g.333674 Transcript_116198/m.333674 type:complete len:90 (-) Transcript_116198:8-277(-)